MNHRWFKARPLALATLTVVAAAASGAGPGVEAGSSAQASIDAMLEALGGRAALASLATLSTEAQCQGPDGPFTTAVVSRRPADVEFLQQSAAGSVQIWSTPERTWTVSQDGQDRELDDAVRAFVRGHEFHLLLFEVEQRFEDHALAEDELAADCLTIRMSDEQGRPASVCLDRANHLPRALELNPEGAEGPVTIAFQRWAWVDGLRYFHAFDLTEGSRRFSYTYTRIEPNGQPPG